MIRRLKGNLFSFLGEYYRRENSESGFSADKRCDGWRIWQRRPDRIDTATIYKEYTIEFVPLLRGLRGLTKIIALAHP